MDVDFEVDENEFILNHVLLPRYLPSEHLAHREELQLMNLMIENVLDTISTMPPQTVQLFQQMKRIHADSSDDNIESLNAILKSEINAIFSDEASTFAIYMHQQNCLLWIKKQGQKLTSATFRSDIELWDDYSNDIEVIFHTFVKK